MIKFVIIIIIIAMIGGVSFFVGWCAGYIYSYIDELRISDGEYGTDGPETEESDTPE